MTGTVRAWAAALAFTLCLALTVVTPAEARSKRSSHNHGGATTSESCLPGVLKQRLSEVRNRFGKITVVSTHRPGARINGSGKPSYHGSCRAVDFVPPSGKYSAVTKFLYATHEGGVGTYTCMNHIHIDNGPNYRWSKCR
ncbi:MAG: DUF882 domain-containing protein [Hyphomicrobiaceae bacterium]|nr:DUF882 domain-containing protein [Hyphomicrobiaceae bacterium]